MKSRFFNANIMPVIGGNTETVFEGEVIVEDGVITSVIDKSKTKKANSTNKNRELFDVEYDCKGNLLLPGFKNAHTHSPMVLLRGMGENKALTRWLTEDIFPREAKLNEEDVYWATKLAIMEYLQSGITSAFDMYFLQKSIIDSFIDCGFRGVFISGINKFGNTTSKVFKRLSDEFESWNNLSPLISYKIGFHAEYTTPPDMLKEIIRAALHYKQPLYTHMSEEEGESESCVERNGCTPMEFLSSLDGFKYGGGIFHGVHMSDNDYKLMKEQKVGVVTCPCSNAKLASGIAPLREYIDKGITLGLGTDGASSNNALDFFKEMYLAACMQRLRCHKADAISSSEVMNMAISGSAKIMGLNDAVCIDKGQKADFMLLNLSDTSFIPLIKHSDSIVYSSSKNVVLATIVNGRILYDRGEYYIGEKPDTIISHLNKTVAKIK